MSVLDIMRLIREDAPSEYKILAIHSYLEASSQENEAWWYERWNGLFPSLSHKPKFGNTLPAAFALFER